MKRSILPVLALIAAPAFAGDSSSEWYAGDERCPPPPRDGRYAPPYRALDHPNDYPTFSGADKPGWSCSYRREDGVIVQFGDSRTPQEQWIAVWGSMGDRME